MFGIVAKEIIDCILVVLVSLMVGVSAVGGLVVEKELHFNITLPTLHIKFGPMKQLVKTLDLSANCFG